MATAEHVASDHRRRDLLELVPGLELIVARALGVGDDARDAVQEVLARALDALDDGREIRGTLGAFVHGIAMHVVADVRRLRQRAAAEVTAVDYVPSGDASPIEKLIGEQERQLVRSALLELDQRDRELLRRCFVDGERIAALALELREPASRLRKRKSRALRRLREILTKCVRSGHNSSSRPTTEA